MWVVLGKEDEAVTTPTSTGRKKKRKTGKPCKNREDSESRRMTHIAVERKRRKQMNDHLATLRSLMPLSHIQRGDQASIVGGAIDFIKELEQLLGMLEVRKEQLQRQAGVHVKDLCADSSHSINGFFTSPQTTSSTSNSLPHAEVEMEFGQSHVNLRVSSSKMPGILLRAVAAMEALHFSILQLSVTTVDESVLYSFNMKIEEGCKLVSANDIAEAAQQIFSPCLLSD